MRSERNGPVTTVVLSRPEVRNAVDGPTAQVLSLAEAAEGVARFTSGAGRHGVAL